MGNFFADVERRHTNKLLTEVMLGGSEEATFEDLLLLLTGLDGRTELFHELLLVNFDWHIEGVVYRMNKSNTISEWL